MHNVWLIAKREYLERVRTKAFILSTILIPLLMGGGIVGAVIASGTFQSTSHIAIVSEDQQLATDLQSELEERQRQQDDRRCHLARQQRHPRDARQHAGR